MRKVSTYYIPLLLLVAVNCIFGSNQVDTNRVKVPQTKTFLLYGWKYNFGDDSTFAALEYNDKSLQVQFLDQFNSNEKGIHWFRTDVNYTIDESYDDPLSIGMINVAMACDVYWDGVYIGSNGKVGTNIKTEIPGKTIAFFKIPHELSRSGDHIVAVRLSNFHGNSFSTWKRISFGYYTAHIMEIDDAKTQYYTYMGIYITALLFCFALFIGSRNERSYLIISIYFLLSSFSFYIDYIMVAQNYTLPIYSRLFVFQLLVANAMYVFINIFFLFFFENDKKVFHIGVMAVLLLFCELSGLRFKYGDLISKSFMLIYSLVILYQGFNLRKKEAAFISTGVGINLIVNIYAMLMILFPMQLFMFPKMAMGLAHIVMLLTVITAISERIRIRNRMYEAVRLKSQRLETELLKKSIQPHFMANTLLSLKSWLSKDTQKAERLIESLSDEFQIISRISPEKEITIGEEIKLCRHHLELMGLRRDAQYELITECLNENEKIPPMVFHTLIENGLTHAYLPKENGTFKLYCEKTSNGIKFILTNDGSRLAMFAGQPDDKIEEGLGLKYVKARLEENYGNKWGMNCGYKNKLWEVEIIIYR